MYSEVHNNLVAAERIVSFGCSMMYGQEMQDANWPLHASDNTFAGLLANRYDCEYVCNALPGGSNDAILRRLHKYLSTERKENDFVIVGWTFHIRREMFNSVENKYQSLLANFYSRKTTQELRVAYDRIHNAYTTMLEYSTDEILDQYFVQQQFYATQAIRSYNIPHLQFEMFNDNKATQIPEFCPLKIDHYIRSTGLPKSETRYPLQHPNERSHAGFFAEVQKWILDNNYKPSYVS